MLVVMQTGIATLENDVTVSIKTECLQLNIYSVVMHTYIHQNACARMFIAAPFIIAPKWKFIAFHHRINEL